MLFSSPEHACQHIVVQKLTKSPNVSWLILISHSKIILQFLFVDINNGFKRHLPQNVTFLSILCCIGLYGVKFLAKYVFTAWKYEISVCSTGNPSSLYNEKGFKSCTSGQESKEQLCQWQINAGEPMGFFLLFFILFL